jgi:hypothetical protein
MELEIILIRIRKNYTDSTPIQNRTHKTGVFALKFYNFLYFLYAFQYLVSKIPYTVGIVSLTNFSYVKEPLKLIRDSSALSRLSSKRCFLTNLLVLWLKRYGTVRYLKKWTFIVEAQTHALTPMKSCPNYKYK